MSNTTNLDLSADLIDVRDIIARFEELEDERDSHAIQDESEEDEESDTDRSRADWAAENPDEAAELAALQAILDELKGYGGDEQWRGDWYPATLIQDDYFEDHARELAEHIGAVNKDARWPNNHIDWTAAAEALQVDYGSVDIDGTDYWYW